MHGTQRVSPSHKSKHNNQADQEETKESKVDYSWIPVLLATTCFIAWRDIETAVRNAHMKPAKGKFASAR